MKVLVCGSRGWRDLLAIDRRIADLGIDSEVIHGNADGADRQAHLACEAYSIPVTAFSADWRRYGKRAGIVRNTQMLNEQPGLVIAFWDGRSRGTAHTIGEARKRGIPVEIITAE